MSDTDEKRSLLGAWRGKKTDPETRTDAPSFNEALRKNPSEIAPGNLEGREQRTHQFEGPAPDGRRLRATGRTEQLNVKVTPEFKKRLEKLAKEKNSSMVAIIEYAVECYEDEIRERKGRD